MLKKTFFHSKQKIKLSKFLISEFSDLDIKKFDLHEFIKNGNFVYVDLFKDMMNMTFDVFDEVVLLFKITAGVREFNYGMAFCSKTQKTGVKFEVKMGGYRGKSKRSIAPIYFNYFNFGKSFSSVDGEYRPIFLSLHNIKHLKTHFLSLWTYHHLFCKKLMEEFKWKLRCETVDGSSVKRTDMEEDILTFVVIECVYLITQKHQFISINDDYLAIFVNPGMRKIYENFHRILMDIADKTEYFRFIKYCFLFIHNELQLPLNKFGIKIMPMTQNEKFHLFDSSFKTWKELMLNKKMSKLIMNFVSPSVSLHNVFFFVKLSDSLFSNRKQIEKINNNDFFVQLHKELETTMSTLKSKKVLLDQIYRECMKSHLKKPLKSYSRKQLRIIEQKCSHNKLILKYIEALERILSKPIDLLFNNIILSDYCLCLVNKNTGNTLINVIKKSLKNEEFKKRVGFYENSDTFHKYLFEILYTLACFHIKMEYIHTDLHYSNITINCISIRNWNFETLPEDKFICYKFVSQYFIFKNTNYYSTIIDMSRCVSKTQKKMLLKFILTYLPEYLKYRNILDFISEQNQNRFVFVIACQLDILLFLERLYVLFEILKLNLKIKKKINDMISFVNQTIKKNMATLIKTYKLPDSRFYADFFSRFFGTFSRKKGDIENNSLCGFYDFNNKLKYTVNRMPSNIMKYIDPMTLRQYILNRTRNITEIKRLLNLL